MKPWLILAAAGAGRRCGAGESKILRPVAGLPVLAHALRAFRGLVDGCLIACREADREAIERLAAAHGPACCRTVPGGVSRLRSVAAALDALPEAVETVLVHDAARPGIHPDDIRACVDALVAAEACLLARPCADTVKRVADGRVVATVARHDLFLAETPQGFRAAIGRSAFAQAVDEGWDCTDDAAVLERAGHAVSVVPARHPNPKLTVAGDSIWIVAVLASRSAR